MKLIPAEEAYLAIERTKTEPPLSDRARQILERMPEVPCLIRWINEGVEETEIQVRAEVRGYLTYLGYSTKYSLSSYYVNECLHVGFPSAEEILLRFVIKELSEKTGMKEATYDH